MIFKQYF